MEIVLVAGMVACIAACVASSVAGVPLLAFSAALAGLALVAVAVEYSRSSRLASADKQDDRRDD